MTFRDEFGDWLYPVDVEKYEGAGAWGETWEDPVEVDVWYEPRVQVITTADGKTATSSTFLSADIDSAHLFNAGAKVTVDGKICRVLNTLSFPNTEDAHVEVYLT